MQRSDDWSVNPNVLEQGRSIGVIPAVGQESHYLACVNGLDRWLPERCSLGGRLPRAAGRNLSQ
jgi:hypothetical protein